MRNDSLDRSVRIMLNVLRLRADYRENSPEGMRALLVEGETDRAFAGRVVQPGVLCLTVNDTQQAREALVPGSARISRKLLIQTLLKYLSLSPEFFGLPAGSRLWPVYGLIDRDFDEADPALRISRLFITDTHDIETLMLSTDEGLLSRVEEPEIPGEALRRALYLAGQLAAFRRAVFEEGTLGTRELKAPDGMIDYAAFTEGDRIVLERLAAYINSLRKEKLPPGKLRQATGKIAARMKKLLDAGGRWKKGFEQFPAEPDEDYWLETGGHDILSAVFYFVPEAARVFRKREDCGLNREFEFALIALYDLRAFRATGLHRKMAEAGLALPADAGLPAPD